MELTLNSYIAEMLTRKSSEECWRTVKKAVDKFIIREADSMFGRQLVISYEDIMAAGFTTKEELVSWFKNHLFFSSKTKGQLFIKDDVVYRVDRSITDTLVVAYPATSIYGDGARTYYNENGIIVCHAGDSLFYGEVSLAQGLSLRRQRKRTVLDNIVKAVSSFVSMVKENLTREKVDLKERCYNKRR
jgi:hypothetical protein